MKDEQFNLLVDLINLVQTNLTARMDRMENKLEETKEELKVDIKEIKEEQKIMKADIEEIKEEQKIMKRDMKNMQDEQKKMRMNMNRIEETIKENTIINKKQHAFMIDLMQKQKTRVI